MSDLGHHIVYLEIRSSKYLEHWPNVPEVYKPVAARLELAGVLTPGGGLTRAGEWLVFDIQSGLSNPLITLKGVLDLWPAEMLRNRDEKAEKFLNLFKLAWNDPEVRSYLSWRLDDNAKDRIRPDTVHVLTGKRADEYPALVNLLPFDIPADFDWPEEGKGDGFDFDFSDPEPAACVPAIEPPQPTAADNCEYCEGTKIDPFEGGPCPQCSEAHDEEQTRYYYHPESNCLFTSNDANMDERDPLVEEVSAEQYAEIEQRLKDEEDWDIL
jgi:hypothetical protein